MERTALHTFVVLFAGTFCFFIVLGLIGMAQSKWSESPVSSMKGMASSVSSRFFMDIIGMELPRAQKEKETSTFSQKNVSSFLFQFFTNINPKDPKSLLAREVPGMDQGNTLVLRSEKGADRSVYPADYTPPSSALTPDPKNEQPDGTSPASNIGTDRQAPAAGTNPPVSGKSDSAKKVIFIYHSHNRESWLPELKSKGATNTNEAYDSEINITLLGKRLAQKLEANGIGALSSPKDYPSLVKDFNYNYSYKYSLKTVQEAFATNPTLKYYLDIHRDSQKRALTTTTLNGKSYAQVYFIVGLRNKHWEQNKAFADKISDRLEKKYPGISRGTYSKPSNTGNAEYNQSFSPNSILIEVGGPENTLEECYRTIDLLAEVTSDIYWNAEKVNVPVKPAPVNKAS